MEKDWVQVFYEGNCWTNTTVFVNPTNETAKICSSKCTHWGYHDDSDWDDTEEIVSIELALERVYPDEKAISAILSNTQKDYSETLEKLAERNKKPGDADVPANEKDMPAQLQEEVAQPKQAEPLPKCEVKTDKQQAGERKTMERKIHWNSGCFDEIDLVYDKASKNEATAKILADLETGALAEARAYSDKIIVDGRPATPEQFDAFADSMKEHVMHQLSSMGLACVNSTITDPKITARLTPHIQYVRCCTAFSILNRLEKLDGALNVLHPKVTLEIQAPLGGKQGLVQIEMLIALLYPWVNVTEVSSGEVAANLEQKQSAPQKQPTPQKQPVPQKQPYMAPAVAASAATKAPAQKEKEAQPGLLARLFGGKKKGSSGNAKSAATAETQNPKEKFFYDMKTKSAFRSAFHYAKAEINSVITKKQFGLSNQSGAELTVSEWEGLPELRQLEYILAMGNHGIVRSALLCIDFVEIIPYCLAITLLYMAYNDPMQIQMLDTGDGADITVFKSALKSLHSCYAKWHCKIMTDF